MKESDFGIKVVEFLRFIGFETWQEVSFGYGESIDLVAKYKDLYFGIELKTTLNDQVLEQSYAHKNYFNYSIAMIYSNEYSRRKISKVKSDFIHNNKLSVVFINPEKMIQEVSKYKEFKSKYYENNILNFFGGFNCRSYNLEYSFNKNPQYNITEYLYDDQKDCVAGSTSESCNKITPFKRSCRLIQEYLKVDSNKTIKQIWEDLHEKLHWSSINSLRSALSQLNNVEDIKKIKELLGNKTI